MIRAQLAKLLQTSVNNTWVSGMCCAQPSCATQIAALMVEPTTFTPAVIWLLLTQYYDKYPASKAASHERDHSTQRQRVYPASECYVYAGAASGRAASNPTSLDENAHTLARIKSPRNLMFGFPERET